jgi:hypothetical protein
MLGIHKRSMFRNLSYCIVILIYRYSLIFSFCKDTYRINILTLQNTIKVKFLLI